MDIKVTRIKPYTKLENSEPGSLMAICDVLINNFIEIENLKIIRSKKEEGEMFVAFPRLGIEGEGKKKEYQDVITFSDVQKKKEIQEAVLKAYSANLINGMYFDNDIKINVEVKNNSFKLKGLASVEMDGICVSGIRIMEGPHGLFAIMPQKKQRDPSSGQIEYKDIISPSSKYQRQLLAERIIDEYEKELENMKENRRTENQVEKKESSVEKIPAQENFKER